MGSVAESSPGTVGIRSRPDRSVDLDDDRNPESEMDRGLIEGLQSGDLVATSSVHPGTGIMSKEDAEAGEERARTHRDWAIRGLAAATLLAPAAGYVTAASAGQKLPALRDALRYFLPRAPDQAYNRGALSTGGARGGWWGPWKNVDPSSGVGTSLAASNLASPWEAFYFGGVGPSLIRDAKIPGDWFGHGPAGTAVAAGQNWQDVLRGFGEAHDRSYRGIWDASRAGERAGQGLLGDIYDAWTYPGRWLANR